MTARPSEIQESMRATSGCRLPSPDNQVATLACRCSNQEQATPMDRTSAFNLNHAGVALPPRSRHAMIHPRIFNRKGGMIKAMRTSYSPAPHPLTRTPRHSPAHRSRAASARQPARMCPLVSGPLALFALLLLTPDVALLAYFGGVSRFAQTVYNLLHSYESRGCLLCTSTP